MVRPSGVWYDTVRYFLAISFLVYGGVKIADIQFNPVYQPYLFQAVAADDLTGFELVWRFFGYSRAYHCLVGLAEVSVACLLLSTRTATLGAVAFLPVIGNVVAVDLLYGVSTDATIVALALMAGDLLLLSADRDKLCRAVSNLVRPRTEGTTRGRVLLGWVLAVALLVIVYGAGALAKTIRGY